MYNTIVTPSTSALVQADYMSMLSDKGYVTIGDPTGAIGETATGSANELRIINNNNVVSAKLLPEDLAQSCKRIPWVTGKTWPAYRSTVVEDIHVETTVGSVVHVFKCLSNNTGGVSTVAPNVVNQTVPFTTADGYVWMYLFTVSETDVLKFATDAALPVFANTTVQTAAVSGTVDTYVIEDKGLGYNNTHSGVFAQSDIRVGSATSYRLGATANSTDDFYNGCRIELTSGAAVGLHAVITDYVGSTRTATIDYAFTTTPSANDTFEISPDIMFTVNAGAVSPIARAIISNGQVSAVRSLGRGKGVRSAQAQVVAHFAAAPTVEAELTVHPSPFYGHGGNQAVEVNTNGILIGKAIDLADGMMPRTGSISTMTLTADPKFTGVKTTIATSLLFQAGEEVLISTPKGLVSSNAAVSGTALTISDTPKANLLVGSTVIVADGTRRVVASITARANSTSFTVAPSISTPADGELYLGSNASEATVLSVSASDVTLKDVSPVTPGDAVYGKTSGNGAVATNYVLQGGDYYFATDTWIIEGSLNSGSISAGQVLTQGDYSGIIFSKDPDNSRLFVVGKAGELTVGTATTSSGSYEISEVAPPMLNLEAGSLLLVSAFAPISINNNAFYCKHHLLI